MRDIFLRPLLTKARDAFNRCGFIPYAFGAQLENAGFIIADLEAKWSTR